METRMRSNPCVRMLAFAGVFALSAFLVGSPAAAKPPIPTASNISLVPNPAVEGEMVQITGSVSTASGDVTGGKIQIQMLVDADGNPLPCAMEGQVGATWVNLNNGGDSVPPASTTVNFDTTGLAGAVIGFRSHYVPTGSGFGQSQSACADLIILAAEFEGCSHGFWKNHLPDWPQFYLPSDLLGDVFGGNVLPDLDGDGDDDTLEDALDFGGGPGIAGAQRILLRNAVAALLNAAHPDVNYPLSELEVLAAVDAALYSEPGEDVNTIRDRLLELEAIFEGYNNLGCPLEHLDDA